ncbi:MAG TPA: pyridoxamine 5'-phosphate oxidase family protein [Clostridiaceae bacterium]|nr:pyridoxamine 5'-phosphate oxidase family protein [Clostridiaceae bacterium]
MFRSIRRMDRAISRSECQDILARNEYGILSTQGKGNYPYATPYNYVYLDGKIYIHSTCQSSHKQDDLKVNPNVCFTVVGNAEVMPERFTTYYESVIVFGTAEVIKESSVKQRALVGLIDKYSHEFMNEGLTYIEKEIDNTAVIKITPIHITGKRHRR